MLAGGGRELPIRQHCRTAALGLLFALAAAVALPRGGVPAWAQIAACGGAALSLALALLGDAGRARRVRHGRSSRRPARAALEEPGSAGGSGAKSQAAAAPTRARPHRRRTPSFAADAAWLALSLVAFAAALQCVPLPAALVRLLAQVSYELRTFPPAPAQPWAPISLDVPATLASLALPVALACAAAAAGLLAKTGRRARLLLCAAPLGAAALQAAIAFGRFDLHQLSGTFVNRNHLAALLCAGAVTAAGAALDRGPRRPLWALSCAVLSAATLLALSRGGAAALVAGLVVVFFLRRSLRAALFGAGLAALAVFAALWLSPAALTSRVSDTAQLRDDSKLRSFAGAALVVRDHLLTGAGRGAFRYLSERHRSVPGEVTFVYVEDEPLQLAADLGVPVALLVLALLGLALRRGLLRARTGLERGAAAALVALALHNLVDFNLELAGVALPAAVALGALAGIGRRRKALTALVAAAPLACLALAWAGPRSAERDAERLLAKGASVTPEELREAVVRHPADWLVSLAPAVLLEQRHEPAQALAWAGRAMQLSPQAWRPHLAAASILLGLGARGQARVETRLALTGERYSLIPWDAIAVAARASKGLDELQEATPDEPPVRAKLVEWLRSAKRSEEAAAVAEAELPRAVGAVRATLLQHLAGIAVERGDKAAAARWALALTGDAPCAAALWSFRAGGDEGALAAGLARCPGDPALGQALVRARIARGDGAGALAAFESLDAERPGSPWEVDAHLLHADALEAAGRHAQSLSQRWLAAQLAPERAELGIDYADRLERQGNAAAAREALRRLSLHATGDARAALEERLAKLGR